MSNKVFSVKVLMEKFFCPDIENYSSFEEITLIGEFVENQELFTHLSKLLNNDTGYENATGNMVTTKLIEIVGIQDVYELSEIPNEYIEIYRYFYTFNRKVSATEFIQLYNFDDTEKEY